MPAGCRNWRGCRSSSACRRCCRVEIRNLDELAAYEERCVAEGYEGVMIRTPGFPLQVRALHRARRLAAQDQAVRGRRGRGARHLRGHDEPQSRREGCVRPHEAQSSCMENKIGRGELGGFVVRHVETGVEFRLGYNHVLGGIDRVTLWEQRESLPRQAGEVQAPAQRREGSAPVPQVLGFREAWDLSPSTPQFGDQIGATQTLDRCTRQGGACTHGANHNSNPTCLNYPLLCVSLMKASDTPSRLHPVGHRTRNPHPRHCRRLRRRLSQRPPRARGDRPTNGLPLTAPTFDGGHWRADRDGSIACDAGQMACEFVSPILHGEGGVEHLMRFVDWTNAIGATVNGSCGCHITVGIESVIGTADRESGERVHPQARPHLPLARHAASTARRAPDRHLNHYSHPLYDDDRRRRCARSSPARRSGSKPSAPSSAGAAW